MPAMMIGTSSALTGLRPSRQHASPRLAARIGLRRAGLCQPLGRRLPSPLLASTAADTAAADTLTREAAEFFRAVMGLGVATCVLRASASGVLHTLAVYSGILLAAALEPAGCLPAAPAPTSTHPSRQNPEEVLQPVTAQVADSLGRSNVKLVAVKAAVTVLTSMLVGAQVFARLAQLAGAAAASSSSSRSALAGAAASVAAASGPVPSGSTHVAARGSTAGTAAVASMAGGASGTAGQHHQQGEEGLQEVAPSEPAPRTVAAALEPEGAAEETDRKSVV